MKSLHKTAFFLIIIFLIPFFGSGQENSNHRLKLNELIIEFEESIKKKDSLRFKKIFFDGQASFVGVMSKKTEMSIKKDYPDFQGIAVSNSTKFINDICKEKNKQLEKFYNINIDSNGSIATISFDYSFHSGTKMIQWGNENWNLVYVDENWLITDVVYSIHFPDVEKFPFANIPE